MVILISYLTVLLLQMQKRSFDLSVIGASLERHDKSGFNKDGAHAQIKKTFIILPVVLFIQLDCFGGLECE